MHLIFFNLLPSCSFKLISNALALSYCRGWVHLRGVHRPNQVLGVICWQHFPGWVTLPGEGHAPHLAMSLELYTAAPAPTEDVVAGVLCERVADIVFRRFRVISPLQN